MAEHIYNVIGEGFFILEVAVIAHFVFLEPEWKKWQCYFNIVNLLVLILAEVFVKSDGRILICLLCAGINISLARERHRIRGFFLVFPIMGICVGMIMPMTDLPEILFGIHADIIETWIDVITFFLLLLFIWRGRSWREKFELELQYRKLQRWESRLLILVGLLLFCLMMPLENIKVAGKLDEEMKTYVVLSSISAMILTATVIVLVMQGNKRAYYENVAALNKSYLDAEVKHFQAYQKTQTETRRVRHDMKNHLQSMLYLANEEEYDELKQYLKNLNSSVWQIDMELHCGNALADAICNEKNQLAALKGISFEIEGRMPENTKLEPVDICTIFANALDNALEALENENLKKRWIKLEISCQGEMIFLRFTNPVSAGGVVNACGNTTKPDKVNHGFGLQNIKLSADKYNGRISTEICKGKEGSEFSLEIMLLD